MRFLKYFILLYFFSSCENTKHYIYKGPKIKGLSFVAPHKEIEPEVYNKVIDIKANWVSLMPYAFVKEGSSTVIYSKEKDKKHQWWGETPEGISECIKMAHQKKLQIMIKPHLWFGNGTFTGDFKCKDDKCWTEFENSYKDYILTFAEIAEKENADLFCIGTELKSFVAKRPDFWINLISEIKKVYHGELTYAENWDCYEQVPFWMQLDYIGVDAYFPLSEEKDPEVRILNTAWRNHIKNLGNFSGKNQKPVIFTEVGYRSCDYATHKPWETDYSLPENNELQEKAYKALKESVYGQDWFAGLFVWKWFPIDEPIWPGRKKDLFTPQNKPALNTIKDMFSN